MIDDATLAARARALARNLEPCIGQVYFAPECHAAYEALGFGPSPGDADGVAMPDGPAYFTSRGSLDGPGGAAGRRGRVRGVQPRDRRALRAVRLGAHRRADDLRGAARTARSRSCGAILGDSPAGSTRAVDAHGTSGRAAARRGPPAVRRSAQPVGRSPPIPLTRFFHLGDELREYRGDAHTVAWTSAGLDADRDRASSRSSSCGLPPRTYIRSRGWSDGELDAASARLTSRGWLGADGFTDTGHAAREEIEATTDRQMQPALDALGDDLDMLVGLARRVGRRDP